MSPAAFAGTWRIPRSAVGAGLLGKAAETVTQVLLITLVPRALGPVDYGTFALALTVVQIGSSSLSMAGPTLMARFVPAVAPADRAALARALGARLARWRAAQIAGVALAAGVLVVAVPGSFDPLLTWLVVGALALDVSATLANQVALGLGRAGVWSARFPLQNTLLLVAVLAGHALAGLDGAVAAIAFAAAGALAFIAAAVAGPLRRAERGAPLPEGAVRFALLAGASGLLVLLQQRGGVVAVAVLAGASAQTGYAALALGAAIAATYVVWQLFAVQLPGLAERAERDLAGAEAEAGRLAWRALAVTLPGALLAAALLDTWIRVLIGASFAGAAEAFAPALATLTLAPILGLATQVSALRLRPGARLRATAAGAVVFAASVVPAVLAFDASGATAALLAGSAASTAWAWRELGPPVSGRLTAASLGGAAVVLLMGIWRT